MGPNEAPSRTSGAIQPRVPWAPTNQTVLGPYTDSRVEVDYLQPEVVGAKKVFWLDNEMSDSDVQHWNRPPCYGDMPVP